MIRLLQNNPTTFQTTDGKTLYNLSGNFYLDNKSFLTINENKLYIDNNIINIYKNTEQIGGSFWLSSIAMLLLLQKYNKEDFYNNKSILELGAGIALPSIYLSNFSNNITSTDDNISIT